MGKTEVFVEKYNDFITELGSLDNDKAVRNEFWKNYNNGNRFFRDDFIKDLWGVAEGKHKKNEFKKAMDEFGVEFFDALNECIESFGINDSYDKTPLSFIGLFNKIFARKVRTASAVDKLAGVNIDAESVKTVEKYMKLKRLVEKELERCGGNRSESKLNETLEKLEIKGKVKKKILKLLNINFESIEGREEILDIPDSENQFFEGDGEIGLLPAMIKIIEWFGKEEKDYYRLFITRDTLIRLKLLYYSEDDIIELKNNTASYNAFVNRFERNLRTIIKDKSTPIGERPGQAGYYRYDTKPAGNPDVYEAIKPVEDKIYDNLMHNGYVKRAIDGNVVDLYTMYELFLNEDFSFANNIMAEVKGCSAGNISKENEKYNVWVSKLIRELKGAEYQ